MLDLPAPIAAYFAADAANDPKALAASFSEEARVQDESQTYTGRTAIETWMQEAKHKYRHTAQPLSASTRHGKTIVSVELTGAFPGSPIIVDHAFTLAGDKIAALEIGLK